MQAVLIDTSTLLDLVDQFPYRHRLDERRPTPSVYDAIEALIVYDSIYIDGPSFDWFTSTEIPMWDYNDDDYDDIRVSCRDYSRHSYLMDRTRFHLRDIKALCIPVYVEKDTAKQSYIEGVEFLQKRIMFHQRSSRKGLPIVPMKISKLYIDKTYMFPEMEDIVRIIPDNANQDIIRIEKTLRARNYRSTALLLLSTIRLFYYLKIQQKHSAHFVPHPNKGLHHIKDVKGTSISTSIFNYFDKQVRVEFEQRKTEILGVGDISLPLPLVSSYILNGVTEWSGLIEKIAEIRASKQAVRYRVAVSELVTLLEQRKNTEVDEILFEIKAAADAWQKCLSITGRSKTIEVSVPFVGGLSTEIDIPYRKFPGGTAGALLTFIHKLLSAA